MGYVGNHLYSDWSSEQCFKNLRICNLHFDDKSFAGLMKQRLSKNACPTLRIATSNLQFIVPEKNEETKEPLLVLVKVENDAEDSTILDSKVQLAETSIVTELDPLATNKGKFCCFIGFVRFYT